jgi:hypothetical protein
MSHDQNHFIAGKGDLALDSWGYQVVVERHSLFHSLFTFDVPRRLFIGKENGVEADFDTSVNITSLGGRVNVITDGVNGSITLLESRRHPRYQPNRAHHCAMSVGVPVAVSAATQDWGIFTDNNGVFFRCDVNGNLNAMVMSGGVIVYDQPIALPDEFYSRDDSGDVIKDANGDPVLEFDVTKGNNYDIDMQWRGVGNIYWFIEDPKTQAPHKVHTAEFLNTLDEELSIENPALPIAYRVSSSGAADGLWSGCADITSSGGEADKLQYYSAISPSVAKSANATAGLGTPVISLSQPLTINSEINTRDIKLAKVIVHADKRGEVTLYTTRDLTAFTGPVFTTINNGSFIEIDTTATVVDETKMERFGTVIFQANQEATWVNPAPDEMPIYLIHGDYLVVVLNSGNTVNIEVTLEWGEEI